jgi:hypothetical protein
VLGVWTIPHRVCEAGSSKWFEGDLETQEKLASSVGRWVDDDATTRAFSTGSPRFDSEWIFGTYQMAALGFGQLALEHPEAREREIPRMERAIERLLSPFGRLFDKATWRRDPIDALDSGEGHIAYYGYTNLVLSLHRSLVPNSRYAALNDRMTAAIARRYARSPTRLLETYPGEIYPVDNAAAIASVALHARALHQPDPKLVGEWSALTRKKYVDPKSGLLVQSVHSDGSHLDAPRGSGTALAAYFLSFGDAELSAELHQAVMRELSRDVAGFRAVKEYARGQAGRGDIDSGPLFLGFSVSATGFSLAGCRIHGDEACFASTLATTQLFGAPLTRADESTYVSGGPLGNAIMFAMQTARPRLR